jgi:inorganic triphosphatase YgiF
VAKARETARKHGDPIETELKLAFPPEAAGHLVNHPALKAPRASAPRSVRLVSTYFNTPRRELARRGISLRVRAAGSRRVQTLKLSDAKSSADGGAATSRGEWDWPISDDKPDFLVLPATRSWTDCRRTLVSNGNPLS